MVDTDLIDSFSSNFKDYMPKLKAEDVTAAIMYALGTPDRVQVKSSCNKYIDIEQYAKLIEKSIN